MFPLIILMDPVLTFANGSLTHGLMLQRLSTKVFLGNTAIGEGEYGLVHSLEDFSLYPLNDVN